MDCENTIFTTTLRWLYKLPLHHVGSNRFWASYSQAMFGQVLMPFRVRNNKVLGFVLTVHPFVEFTA